MRETRPKHHEYTGLVDREGTSIFEGAILERWYNQLYGDVRSVVVWDAEKGAWVDRGHFASGSGWVSLNGQNFKYNLIVGHIDETPEELYPAVKKAE